MTLKKKKSSKKTKAVNTPNTEKYASNDAADRNQNVTMKGQGTGFHLEELPFGH